MFEWRIPCVWSLPRRCGPPFQGVGLRLPQAFACVRCVILAECFLVGCVSSRPGLIGPMRMARCAWLDAMA